MPSWDKTTNSFKGRIRISGYPQKIKTGFKTKTAARKWELFQKDQLKFVAKIHSTFSQASNNYLNFCNNHEYVPGTIVTKAQIFRDFITFLKIDPPLDQIDEDMIESYLNSKPRKKTSNRHLRELKTLFNWLIKKDYCEVNPCNKIEKYRVQEYIPYVPPPKDVNKVLIAADEFEFDFLQSIYHLSARRKEVMNLKWDDIDFENKTVGVWTRKRKGGTLECDVMQMNRILENILQRKLKTRVKDYPFVFCWENGEKLKRTHIEKMVKKLCVKAGVKPFGFHAIRHHVSALMASSKKLSLVEIQKQLRHKNATTTDKYLKSLITESNAANIIEEMQGRVAHENVIPIAPKKRMKNIFGTEIGT
jgi:integrase